MNFIHIHLFDCTHANLSADRVRRFALLALASVIFFTVNRLEAQQPAPGAPVPYSQGDPTNEEQYLLQLLNRARMDPVGEGQRLAAWLRTTTDGKEVTSYYVVDPNQVASDFAVLPAVPPLAFNSDLIASARAHSADLAPHDGLGPNAASDPLNNHLGYDGSTPDDRVKASGFRSADGGDGLVGENFDPGGDTLYEIHAGYLVDWGNPGFGHRRNSMNGAGDINVVGIGLATKPTSVNTVFPLVETEDYGWPGFVVDNNKVVPANVPAQLVGVVYADTNGNGQYDPGEGIAGVTVTMDNGYYYTVTSTSGGYALPLVNADASNVDGPATVHMSGPPGEADRTTTITVANYETVTYGVYCANVEWDGVDNQTTGTPPAVTNSAQASISGGGTVAKGSKLKLVVTRPENSDITQPLTVAYKLKGTAAANVDYVPLPGTVTIPAGKATAKIKITALDQTVINRPPGTITLVLKLKGVAGAQGKATVTFAP